LSRAQPIATSTSSQTIRIDPRYPTLRGTPENSAGKVAGVSGDANDPVTAGSPPPGSGVGSTDVTLAGTPPSTNAGPASAPGGGCLAPGVAVGRYVVLSRLGAGGMGVVYLAYDPELDRNVALKVLRRSIDGSDQARARQLREAQALARLTHPNVVTVFDVGTFADRTFLAMELVRGETLRAWMGAAPRGWREVLAVMLPAGRALAAAHAANLVHRDFKPDNVMVEDEGRVLVMDFGLARTLDLSELEFGSSDEAAHSATLRNLATRVGLRGTPGYMAPEQHLHREGDERVDQFGFCVTLWEVLYGERPHPGESLGALVHATTQGIVRAPPAARRVPTWLRRAIERGLATEPDQRWPSMNALLDELSRGQSRATRRWVTAGAIALALVGVGVVAARQIAETRAAEACAREGASILAIWPGPEDRVREEVHAAFGAVGLGYAEDAYARATPWLDDWAEQWRTTRQEACDAGRRGRDAHVQDAAIACLDEHRAALEALAGAFSRADATVVRRSVTAAASLPRLAPCADDDALRRAPRPPSDAEVGRVADIRAQLGRGRALFGAGLYRDARQIAVDAVTAAEALGWRPLTAVARRDAGWAADGMGDPETAEADLQMAYLTALGAGDDETAAETAIHLVTVVGQHRARVAEGVLWGEHAAALLQRTGSTEGRQAAELESGLAGLDRMRGDHDRAIARLERSIALRSELVGPDHPDLARPRNNLANVHLDRGDYDEATRLYTLAIADFESALGPDHPDTAQALNNLGALWFQRSNLDEAERYFGRALAIRRRGLGPEHHDVAESIGNLAAVRLSRGDDAGAATDYEHAIEIEQRALGSDHPQVAKLLVNLGIARANLGELEVTVSLYERALSILRQAHTGDHADTAALLTSMAEVDAAQGRLDDAEAHAEEALGMSERSVGAEHPITARTRAFLGRLALERDQPERGRASCTEAAAQLERSEGPLGFNTHLANVCVVEAALALGDARAAVEGGERELLRAEERAAPPGETAGLRFLLARALWEVGDDRPRARRLVVDAVADYDPSETDAKARAQRWLLEHPAS
jgi:tetratricopeptide (TPR) repeat protein